MDTYEKITHLKIFIISIKISIMNITILNKKQYLLATVSGEYDFEELKGSFFRVKEECFKLEIFKVFIDLTKMHNIFPNSGDRYFLGEEGSRVFGFKIKLAVLANPCDITHYGETVAINRGVFVKVSSEREALLEWLLK